MRGKSRTRERSSCKDRRALGGIVTWISSTGIVADEGRVAQEPAAASIADAKDITCQIVDSLIVGLDLFYQDANVSLFSPVSSSVTTYLR